MVEFERTYCDILQGKLDADSVSVQMAKEYVTSKLDELRPLMKDFEEILGEDYAKYESALDSHNKNRYR